MYRSILRILSLLALVFSLIGPNLPVQALPDLTTEVNQSLPASYPDLFFVYFRYGNPTATTITPQLQTQLTLEGQGLEIVPEQIYDLYYPQEEGQTIPQIPVCSNEYAGFDYPIDPGLLKNGQQLTYGPQSATTLLQPSGQSTSQLPPRTAGCLRIGLKVKPGAQPGQTTQLVFNPDVNQSTPELSPGIQTLQLTLTAEPTCPEDQELANGQCVAKCSPNQVRDTAGQCLNRQQVCQTQGKELYEGICVPACQKGQTRRHGQVRGILEQY